MEKILHGFDGNCRPSGFGKFHSGSQLTFSVGIFQILPKANGQGTKRGPVKVRVKGYTIDPEAVYTKAREIVDLLDAGKYNGPRNVSVGPHGTK